MKITEQQLRDIGACAEGLDWFRAQGTEDAGALVRKAVAGGKVSMRYANWALPRLMDKQQSVLYACFAARQVLPLFEKRFPQDKRPRAAIEAAEKWPKEPSLENARAAADAAAYAAYAAAAYAADAYSRTLAKILRYGVKILTMKGDK